MAGEGVKVHDLFVTVVQRSAAEVVLRPQVAAETDATVDNPSHAIDGDPAASYAELYDATTAVLSLTQFANSRQVSDAGRDWVELHLVGEWSGSPDAADTVEVEFRGISTDGWTSLDTALGGAEWVVGVPRVFEVTTEAGTNLEANWELQFTYTRNAGAGVFRVYDATAQVGGTVVSPTQAEIAEDVEELAQAKFAGWWATLTAAVTASLVEFGSTPLERTPVLTEVDNETTAADAYTALPLSAARAQAEAYEDTAEATGFPRYTGDPTP